MNKKICKDIIRNKKKFIHVIFTKKQIYVIEKYLKGESLTNTQRTYLYSSIKNKVDALSFLGQNFYFYGQRMIPERIKKAKEILSGLAEKKAFISGSFLFSKEYMDIDVYIISNKRKQYHKGKLHFIHITDNDLANPLFQSAASFSIANFFIDLGKRVLKRMKFNDLVVTYETAIVEILDNDDQKTIREIIFEYYLQIHNNLLNSYELYMKTKEIINNENKIGLVNSMVRELLLNSYSRRYIYNELLDFVRRLEENIAEYKANENLKIYKELFENIKNECARSAT